MERPSHPLRQWMQDNGYGRDFERVASQLPGKITGESLRMIISGYRLPSWDLAFDLEVLTGLSAHDIRDPQYFAVEAA